jgi:hypothetical protein
VATDGRRNDQGEGWILHHHADREPPVEWADARDGRPGLGAGRLVQGRGPAHGECGQDPPAGAGVGGRAHPRRDLPPRPGRGNTRGASSQRGRGTGVGADARARLLRGDRARGGRHTGVPDCPLPLLEDALVRQARSAARAGQPGGLLRRPRATRGGIWSACRRRGRSDAGGHRQRRAPRGDPHHRLHLGLGWPPRNSAARDAGRGGDQDREPHATRSRAGALADATSARGSRATSFGVW